MSALEGYRISLDQKDVPQGTLSRLKMESVLNLNSKTVNTRSGCMKTNLNHSSSTGPVVVQKLANTNQGLIVNQSSNFAP